MRRMLTAWIGVVLIMSGVGARAQGDPLAAEPEGWSRLAAANNLNLKKNAPFHLGMTFQLYDLKGKPAETGSFETWWAAPGSQRTVVHLTGLNENGSVPDGADAALLRDSYLVSQLIESAIRPVPPVPTVGDAIRMRTVNFGKIKLDCAMAASGPAEQMNAEPTTACVEPQETDVLLLQGLGGKALLLRGRVGKFHDTYVGLDLRLAYLGADSIAGKVTILQNFDPATSEAPANAQPQTLRLPGEAIPGGKAVRMSGGVIAGHRIRFVEPIYPIVAKMQHRSGSVLLNAIIGKDGSVERLVPIASTNEIFTNEAMNAVRQWKYSPYLLNGEPTKVDSTIIVNFAMN